VDRDRTHGQWRDRLDVHRPDGLALPDGPVPRR
jgi:hypothetical protein